VASARIVLKVSWESKSLCIFLLTSYNPFMKILYIADNWGHFASEISTYEKRLKWQVEWIQIRPVKHTERAFVIKSETEKVVAALTKLRQKAYILDEFGQTLSTMEFSEKILHQRNTGKEIIFVVWGSFGLDREMLRTHTEASICLSGFTLPHWLALLVLSEQLYRIHEIWKGSKYHHE